MLQYKIVIFIAVFHSQTRPSGNGQGWASCRCVCGQWNKTTAEKAVCKGWIPKSESLHCCLVRDSEAVHNSVFRLWSGKLYSKAEKVLNVPRIRKKDKKKERSAKLLSILLPFAMLVPLSTVLKGTMHSNRFFSLTLCQ